MKTLKFTTVAPCSMFALMADKQTPLVEIEGGNVDANFSVRGKSVYIHGDAEALAGFDIPFFLDGPIAQLDEPIEKQDIEMHLPSGVYKCVAELNHLNYHITLKK